jgi:hypothetical protein
MDTLDTMYLKFLEREQQYRLATDEIWSHIDFVAEGVSKYLRVPPNTISWNSVEIIGPEMVIMVSMLSKDRHQYAPPGSLASRILTIIIPISVVETNDAAIITQYLNETEDVRSNDTHPEIERGGVIAYINTTRRMIH